MALLTRVRAIAAKVEGTPGTAEALTVGEGAFNVFDPHIQLATEMEERIKQTGFSMLPSVPGGRLGRATFAMELTAPGVSPAGAATFFPACGLGLTAGAYVLDAKPPDVAGSTQETVTIGLFEDGIFKYIYGAMGNAKFTFPAAKKVRVDYDFLGIWGNPSTVGIIGPEYPTDPPLRFVSSQFLIGAWPPVVSQVTLDLGNAIYMREDSTKISGYGHAVIGNRLVKGTLNPEASLTKYEFAEWLAKTEATFALRCGSGNDEARFAATKLQFLNVQEGDRSGVFIHDIEFQLNNDDLSITFTTTAATTYAP